ncbi:hypothetical protein GXP67_01080 [Rhodocytophaga rosea]|uniref:Uncharacterized protein n=1 Tax=Rhodocytophaga rosea TaxID=2704465 RepID=A0A6C0GBP6_9BACT|nr:hypothetical protein [Rhodocytophaga rosea]QHT65366.1 hypothetical protein GXP67_01080 [Rhodocytophaga rosea]
MEENMHSLLPDESDDVNHNSGQHQEEIHFLNEDTSQNFLEDEHSLYSTPPAENAHFLEMYKKIVGIELLAEDEEIKQLIRQFEAESLLNLQQLDISISELVYNGTLLSLSSLIPAKVGIQLTGLVQPLVLLIQPGLTDAHVIHLTPTPYAKCLSPIPLTLTQQDAIKGTAPFFMFKRVVDGVQSQTFEYKRNELWDTLTLSVSIQKKLFKELMEVIKYKPLEAEKWVQNQYWTTERSEKAVKIIDCIFPVQLGLFTGLHLLFYPFECLHRFPHLQATVQSRLFEQ